MHYHALLKYQNVPAPEAAAALWKSRAGDAKVEVYSPGRGNQVGKVIRQCMKDHGRKYPALKRFRVKVQS